MRVHGKLALTAALCAAAAACADDEPDSCSANTLPTLASPIHVAVDGDAVYWTESGGAVRRARLDGSDATTIASSDPRAYAIAAGAGRVFVTAFTDRTDGSVSWIPQGGGDITPLSLAEDIPYAILGDAARVYWVNREGGAVRSADIATGAAVTLASVRHAVDIARAGDTLFAAGADGVFAVPAAGGDAVRISDRIEPARSLATDGRHVYWLEDYEGVFRAPVGGGAAEHVFVAPDSQFGDVETDGVDVYATDTTRNELFRVPVSGGGADTLCAGLDNPISIALTDDTIYFTDSQVPMVAAVPKRR